MNNPYEVLGVSQNASEEEIKTAYKALVKKYHPDKYQNNPLADLAEEKLQEINEAYDMVMKGRSGSSTGRSTRSGSWGPASGRGYAGSANSGNTGRSDYYAVRQAIDRGDLMRAEQMLIHAPARDAEWFFLSGVLSYRKGWLDDGISNLRQAIDMDPNNFEYQRVYQQMIAQGSMYRNRSDGEGYNRNDDCCTSCCTFYCLTSWCSPCW